MKTLAEEKMRCHIRDYPYYVWGKRPQNRRLVPGPYAVRDEHGNCGYRMVEADRRISDFVVLRVDDLFNPSNKTLSSYLNGRRTFILLDPMMAKKDRVQNILDYIMGHNIDHILLPLAEQRRNEMNKSQEVIADLVGRIAPHDPMKNDVLLVIGGGVTKDLGAYLASTFRRSTLPYIVVPTTTTCMVDAALSPKTALNVAGYKNVLGTVYAPSAVFYDPRFLRSLDRRHLAAGAAEIAKIAIVRSTNLFYCLCHNAIQLLRKHFQGPLGSAIIDLSILLFLKMKYEKPFPGNKPASLRAFGHYFSRRLEQLCGYEMEHGEAVAIEICVATNLAFMAGILPWAEREDIFSLLVKLDLPTQCCECTPHNLWSVFERKYENRQESYFPIPGHTIGQGGFLNRFSFEQLAEAIKFLPSARPQHFLGLMEQQESPFSVSVSEKYSLF